MKDKLFAIVRRYPHKTVYFVQQVHKTCQRFSEVKENAFLFPTAESAEKYILDTALIPGSHHGCKVISVFVDPELRNSKALTK